jgi:hypothetical protein
VARLVLVTALVGTAGWLTHWSYAVHCVGTLLATLAGISLLDTAIRELRDRRRLGKVYGSGGRGPVPAPGAYMLPPLWMCTRIGVVSVFVVVVVCGVAPMSVAVIRYPWWWALVGYVFGGAGAVLLLTRGVGRPYMGRFLAGLCLAALGTSFLP